MNHDFIEIEFTELKDGKRIVKRYEDKARERYSVREFTEGLHIHRTVDSTDLGAYTHTTQFTVPWHRIWEIRYSGER